MRVMRVSASILAYYQFKTKQRFSLDEHAHFVLPHALRPGLFIFNNPLMVCPY